MASRMRQTTNSSSYLSVLRIESLERRCLLSVSMGLVGTTTGNAANQLVVADFNSVASSTTTCVLPEAVINSTVELPTTEVQMPGSSIPEGTIQRFDRAFPPINVVTEETVRMPEKSEIPEGTIQRFDRPFPPIYVNAAGNPFKALPAASTNPFVSTVLPKIHRSASFHLAGNVGSNPVSILGPRLLPSSPDVPLPSLPSREAHPISSPDAAGCGLNIERHAVLRVGLKTGDSNVINRQSESGDTAKKNHIEQLRLPNRESAARDIALLELTSRELKSKHFGRQVGITF